ncbi:MAG: methyltransferase domain-containing protein [Vulcanimicrobiaceae bacterium]
MNARAAFGGRLAASELIDGGLGSPAEIAGTLADMARANRAFGGIAPLWRALARSGARTVLDVGCGDGNVARALVDRASAAGRRLEATGLDCNEAVLAVARDCSRGAPALRFVPGDATSLPFVAGTFDVAYASLVLHHLEPEAAVRMLRELRRVARMPLVCDLRRSRAGFVAAWLFGHFLTRNRLTRHDAPLSVRRAYTLREAEALARSAGWRAPHAQASPFFRMLLVDSR